MGDRCYVRNRLIWFMTAYSSLVVFIWQEYKMAVHNQIDKASMEQNNDMWQSVLQRLVFTMSGLCYCRVK